jgi:penicillin-binding protein 1C
MMALSMVAVAALLVAVALEPFPVALRAAPPPPSVRVLDRHGRSLVEVKSDGVVSAPVSVGALPEHVIQTVLAAEDARFFEHPGIDPLAIARAVAQLVREQRVVSGASTLTQQLARNVVPRPRSLRGKLAEMIVALRIEAELDKSQILQEYLSRVEFGPNVRGIEAASRLYFDKPAALLDLAEAATLAAIPRGPTLYDPLRGTDRVKRRRDRILSRMSKRGGDATAIDGALATPVRLNRSRGMAAAPHFVRRLLSPNTLGSGVDAAKLRDLETTLDLELQREVEALTRATAQRMTAHDGSAAAVVVVQNDSREVLAYVGSPDFFSKSALGQNDGAHARRQPGSTLKPFVYAAAIEQLGLTAASILPDLELHLPSGSGDFSPRNYDGKYHGPVRVREALGASLNIPAVYLAHRLGPDHVLGRLRRFGFTSLDRDGSHYGAAIALGDGEVRLVELAAAYSALARDGSMGELRFARRWRDTSGHARELPQADEWRALRTETAQTITDILADPAARQSAFGRESVLDLPFPVAAKTGTSKAYRDNWTVGYTREVTVAVWVGNFDGHPLRDSSGVTGAGPLFRDVMLAAMRGRHPAPLLARAERVPLQICALSGERATAACSHRVVEWFPPAAVPRASCSMHVRAFVNASGELAATSCGAVRDHVFEQYSPLFATWALRAGRPVLPSESAAGCAAEPATRRSLPAVITYPADGARFLIDPGRPLEQQEIVLAARAPGDVRELTFEIDGRAFRRVRPPFTSPWVLVPGEHQLRVVDEHGRASESVGILVR